MAEWFDTFDINGGMRMYCCSNQSSGTGDLTQLSQQLQDLIDIATANGTTLADMLQQMQANVAPTNQFMATTNVAGVIPAGATSYTIINLGDDPNSSTPTRTTFTIDGETFKTSIVTFGNNGDGHPFATNIPYDPNGNYLLVIYNLP